MSCKNNRDPYNRNYEYSSDKIHNKTRFEIIRKWLVICVRNSMLFSKKKTVFYYLDLEKMDYSKESQDRMKKIQDLKDAGVIVYANNFQWKIDIAEIRERSESDDQGGYIRDLENLMAGGGLWEFRTAGRIITHKSHGKLAFAKLRDHSWDMQICFMRDLLKFNTGRNVVETISVAWEEKTAYKIAEKFCQVGDYIAVLGDLFETKHGELTILVSEFQIMSKAVRPLPEKWHGIQDQEAIYRQRYLDLITNDESYQRFLFRSEYIRKTREFYLKNNFVEVETPILGNSASWAAAAPFVTRHNDFNEDFFLRIAPETSLKKATVGRFERVFEIGKNFRNEWSDPSHMQEFSVVEHYAAWWNYEDNMKFTEDMFDYIFDEMNLDRKRIIKDKEWQEREVDFSTPWKRIDYIVWVKEKSWIDIEQYGPEDDKKLRSEIQSKWHNWEGIETQATATMIDYLYKKVLRPTIIGPAFIYNYPKAMQPLARQSDKDDSIVEQFQVVLNGWEIIKAYSELIDPQLQQENFDGQSWALEAWDEEATSWDDDFVLSMEYGMPPQSGWAVWFDRITSLLTGQENLRDVVLFPLMKSDNNQEKTSKKTQLAVTVLNKESQLERWQELNTVGHLSASFAAREGKHVFLMDEAKSMDGYAVPMNMQHAIMVKQVESHRVIKELYTTAEKTGLRVVPFTREMIETSDDTLVWKQTAEKSFGDIEFLGIMIFGEKKQVEKITKDLALYS